MYLTLYPSVCRPYINGHLTYRIRLIQYLAINGATTKRELFNKVWGFNPEDRGQALRGWASSTFSYLHSVGAIHYDRHTRKWSIGSGGVGALEVMGLVA